MYKFKWNKLNRKRWVSDWENFVIETLYLMPDSFILGDEFLSVLGKGYAIFL